MPRTFAQFMDAKTSPVLFLVLQKTYLLVAIEAVLLAGITSDAEEWVNQVIAIPF